MQVVFQAEAINDYIERLQNETSAAIVSNFLSDNTAEITEIVRRNNRRVFGTQGQNLNEDWGAYKTTGKGRSGKVRVEGRPVNLVDTGNLLASMVTVSLRREGNRIFWESDVDYSQYVAENYVIYGVDGEALNEIAALWGGWFQNRMTAITNEGGGDVLSRIMSFFRGR